LFYHTMIRLLGLGVVAALAILITLWMRDSPRATHPALVRLPAQMVWAWERNEDLRWLPAHAGVAYLRDSIILSGTEARIYPRRHPLLVRADTVLVPVIHVDASWRDPPALTQQQQSIIVERVLRAARNSPAHVVQLDFEVRRSQRAFLRGVVSAIRQQLAADTALSITALASWCAGDYWLRGMAADEIVPMLFRMANDDATLRKQLAQRPYFSRRQCQGAAGLATDEPLPRIETARYYYFSPTAWTPASWFALPSKSP
jgi:hypothetical protein